jgi:hypothetical protein
VPDEGRLTAAEPARTEQLICACTRPPTSSPYRLCCAPRPIVAGHGVRTGGIADCADLRIVPILTWYALRRGSSCRRHRHNPVRVPGCTPAPRRHCAQDLPAATPILRATIGVKALTRMRFRLGSAVRCFARQLAIPQFGFRTPRVRPLGLCRPRRPISLLCRGVHERRRHNRQVPMPMWASDPAHGGACRATQIGIIQT